MYKRQAVILVPRDWSSIKRYTEYFMRNRRYFFSALLLANLADVADSWFKGGWDYVVGMGPVSYTHLDVYKRQSTWCWKARRTSAARSASRPTPCRTSVVSVSYTHLDVYKRQIT